MDKRHARRSIFIRSMLGEGNSGEVGHKPIQPTATAAGSRSETGDSTKGAINLDGHATPPPESRALGGDPDGYANPFASNNDDSAAANEREMDFANGFAEARSNMVQLPNIRGVVLEKVVEFLCWNAKYHNAKDVDIPGFEHRIPPEIALELLMAADFLMEAL